ncbi:MAG: SEC-C domain-containing protein [Spirochaetales bacterium]|nr:SEC-C domain-containing protein [Spirochaetales bacterium]
MERVFDGKVKAKLGSKKNPARVNVQTEERYKEVEAKFKKNDWEYIIELTPDEPEDISDLDILLNTPKTFVAGKTVGRNDPCPCGSGKKYKKCCGK